MDSCPAIGTANVFLPDIMCYEVIWIPVCYWKYSPVYSCYALGNELVFFKKHIVIDQ